MEHVPLISILITTYNRSDMLRRSMECVLRQDFTDFELFVIDDCSDDDTQEVIESFNDPRVINIRNEENVGAVRGDRTHKRRFIYELARGKYFANCCDDDYWMNPDLLSRQVAEFEKHENLAMVIGGQLTVYLDDFEPLPFIDSSNLADYIDPVTYAALGPKVAMHDAPLTNGFMTSEEFLSQFSVHPAACNLNGGASLMSKRHFHMAEAVRQEEGARWQAGYEWFLGPASFGDVVYFKRPELVVEARPKNASFQWTQVKHYNDAIFGVELAFKVPLVHEEAVVDKAVLSATKQEIIRQLSQAFLGNTRRIKVDGHLGLASKENMRDPVMPHHVMKHYRRLGIEVDKNDKRAMMGALRPRALSIIQERVRRIPGYARRQAGRVWRRAQRAFGIERT